MEDTQHGIGFRGHTYRLEKKFKHGTHRICSPAETYAKIEHHFPQIGLTRLANITGLDRLGLPVVLSVRPNSAYLSVDAGKGFTLEAARVSAAMECIERYHAERELPDSFCMSYEDVCRSYNTVPLDRLPAVRHAIIDPRNTETWVLGWDIINQCEVAVPSIMVTMHRHLCRPSDLMAFQSGSNGLASGNAFLEALCSGLYEAVERDAVTCNLESAAELDIPLTRVRLDSIAYPLVREQLDSLAAASIQPIIYDCTIDTNVPTYMAVLYDKVARNIGMYRGYGAHLDPEIAMIRSLTEAAQGRLIYIAGSRDDFFRSNLRRLQKMDDRRIIDHLEVGEEVDAVSIPLDGTNTFEGDLAIVLERLKAVGLDQVIVFDLTMPGFDVSVVRVIVPGLEGYRFHYYQPGARCRQFLKKRSAEKGNAA